MYCTVISGFSVQWSAQSGTVETKTWKIVKTLSPNDACRMTTHSPSRTRMQKFRVRHTSVHASDNHGPDRWLHTTVSLTLATVQPNNPRRWAMASSCCRRGEEKVFWAQLSVIALNLLIESRCQKQTMSGGERRTSSIKLLANICEALCAIQASTVVDKTNWKLFIFCTKIFSQLDSAGKFAPPPLHPRP